MTKSRQKLVLIGNALFVLLFGSCAPVTSKNQSNLNYDLSYAYYNLTQQVKQTSWQVCLEFPNGNADSNTHAEWRGKITTAIMNWIKPIREWTSAPLVSDLQFTEYDPNCEVTVRVYEYIHAITNTGTKPIVNVSRTGQHSNLGTLAHEFGHGFGLGDTYFNGTAGYCQEGQPNSLMCDNFSFNEPQTDDIAGLKQIFQMHFPNDRPGTPVEPIDGGLYAGLPDSTNILGRFPLFFSYQAKQSGVPGEITYCLAQEQECDDKHLWLRTDTDGTLNASTRVQAFAGVEDGEFDPTVGTQIVSMRFTGRNGDRIKKTVKISPR